MNWETTFRSIDVAYERFMDKYGEQVGFLLVAGIACVMVLGFNTGLGSFENNLLWVGAFGVYLGIFVSMFLLLGKLKQNELQAKARTGLPKLDFIPAKYLNWRPKPELAEALSALEQVG